MATPPIAAAAAAAAAPTVAPAVPAAPTALSRKSSIPAYRLIELVPAPIPPQPPSLQYLILTNSPINAAALAVPGAISSSLSSKNITPLHVAAMTGNEGAARQLLAAGASPAAQDSEGCIPLHHAIMRIDAPLVALLQAADKTNKLFTSARNREGLTPQDLQEDLTRSHAFRTQPMAPAPIAIPSSSSSSSAAAAAAPAPLFYYRDASGSIQGGDGAMWWNLTHSRYTDRILVSPRSLIGTWTDPETPLTDPFSLALSTVVERQTSLPSLYIANTGGVQGWDVYPNQDIRPGTLITFYSGERTAIDADTDYGYARVDSEHYRNEASMIKHSFPNTMLWAVPTSSQTLHWSRIVGHCSRVVGCFAISPIKKGDLLGANYGGAHPVTWKYPLVELRKKEMEAFFKTPIEERINQISALQERIAVEKDRETKLSLTIQEMGLQQQLSYPFHTPSTLILLMLKGLIPSSDVLQLMDTSVRNPQFMRALWALSGPVFVKIRDVARIISELERDLSSLCKEKEARAFFSEQITVLLEELQPQCSGSTLCSIVTAIDKDLILLHPLFSKFSATKEGIAKWWSEQRPSYLEEARIRTKLSELLSKKKMTSTVDLQVQNQIMHFAPSLRKLPRGRALLLLKELEQTASVKGLSQYIPAIRLLGDEIDPIGADPLVFRAPAAASSRKK